MGYYIRYIITDEREITLPVLESNLKRIDTQYSISNIQKTPRESGDLMYDNEVYGQIEINLSGDGLFEEELEERGPQEVWGEAPKGVGISNFAFEIIEPQLVSGIISELGIYNPMIFVEELKRNYSWMFENQ